VTSNSNSTLKLLERFVENATCLDVQGSPIACALTVPLEAIEGTRPSHAIYSSAYWHSLISKAWRYLTRERRPRFKLFDFPSLSSGFPSLSRARLGSIARNYFQKITNVSRFASQRVLNHQSAYVVCCSCFSTLFAQCTLDSDGYDARV
jgi:hypothetical protein